MAPQLRFDYSPIFAEKLASFAKENINTHRKEYKEKWIFWKNTNRELYNIEIQNIINKGYEGNPDEKIYESVRYYYRKKLLIQTKPKKQIPKQKLAPLSNEITEQMDKHILEYISIATSKSITNKKYLSPAAAFAHYCETNQPNITKEVYRLKKLQDKSNQSLLDPIQTEIKFKKSYKNRFYILLHK